VNNVIICHISLLMIIYQVLGTKFCLTLPLTLAITSLMIPALASTHCAVQVRTAPTHVAAIHDEVLVDFVAGVTWSMKIVRRLELPHPRPLIVAGHSFLALQVTSYFLVLRDTRAIWKIFLKTRSHSLIVIILENHLFSLFEAQIHICFKIII
jgi:hypothetical protein